MKLLECHIANFGQFSNYNLTFEDGMNVVMQPNGWGKTTLAAFVKAMLYGFGTKRIRDVSANERLRYRPWQGGNYGGTLDFEHDGKQYRIIRTFGDTARFDECKVMDLATGKNCPEIGNNVGEWLFGLDSNAFQKSVFITAQDVDADAAGSSLRARLNTLVNEADDVMGLDKALGKLDTRRKFYKKTGNRGQIDDVTKEIAKLIDNQKTAETAIAEMGRLQEGVDSTDEIISRFDEQLATAKKGLEQAQAASSDSKSVLKVLGQLEQQKNAAQQAYETAVEEAGKTPSPAQLNDVAQKIGRVKELDASIATADEALATLKKSQADIAAKYAGALPSAEVVQKRRELLAEMQRDERQLADQQAVSSAEGASSALFGNPELLNAAEDLLARWPQVEQARNQAVKAQQERDVLAAQIDSSKEASLPSSVEVGSAQSVIASCEQKAETCKKMEQEARSAKVALEEAERILSKKKSAAEQAEAKADENRRSVENAPKPASPAAGIACIALGIACIVGGFLLGPAEIVSFAAYGVGAVLAILGGVLLAKRSKAASGMPQIDQSLVAARDKARTESDAQREAVKAAESKVAETSASLKAEQAALVHTMAELFPGESFNEDTVVVQVTVFMERLSNAAKAAAKADEDAKRLVELDKRLDESRAVPAAFEKALREVMQNLHMDTDGVDMALCADRLKSAVASYKQESQALQEQAQHISQLEKNISGIREELNAWVQTMGLGGMAALTPEWFVAVDSDMQAMQKLMWDIDTAQKQRDTQAETLNKLLAPISVFCDQFSVDIDGDCKAQLDALRQKSQAAQTKKAELDAAEKQLADYKQKNSNAIAAAQSMASQPEAVRQLEAKIAQVQQQREQFVRDKAQQEEKISQMQKALDSYPAIKHEIRLLTAKRQKSIANLFTITKTAELLQQARQSLDGRYLGDLGDRFNDYADAWLVEDGMSGQVDGDFNISITNDAGTHDALNFSSGYCDVVDMSLRLALVDILFEKDKPFLIMDDPFASLDAKKISRALALLAVLSQKYQIIYFTCHPSRMEGGAVGAEDAESIEFVLPEQRAARETPKARAKREAEQRAAAQAALVASYEVTGATNGRAALGIEGGSRVISNNLFNVRFAADCSSGPRNNSFEVHFIDEKGRVLCDRQTVEIVDGRVIPDTMRFCLCTQNDSGKTYTMIVHEDDKPVNELVLKEPYKVEVAFTTQDFGF